MNRGIKGKIKAWIYMKVLGDFRKQMIMLLVFAVFVTPIVIMQQILPIILPTLTQEKGEIVRLSELITDALIVVTIICILTQLHKMIENKIFCLGLIINAFAATISCILYKDFLEAFENYAVELVPCALPYLISISVVGIVYCNIWKNMNS